MKRNSFHYLNKMPAWGMGVLLLLCSFSLHAQTFTRETPYLTTLDVKAMGSWLANAPMELTPEAKAKAIVTDLPLPGGGTVTVRVEKSLIAPQEVYDRLPEIMTYSFQGVDDPSVRGRLTLSPKGAEAILSTKDGDVYIEAESYGSATHKVFYKQAGDFPHSNDDARYPDGFEHKHTPDGASHQHEADPAAKMMMSYSIGAIRREFRMHVIADKEYSVALCGANPTRSCVEMAIMTAVNNMNSFYTPEMAVKLNLTANTTIYLTGNPSGFAAGGSGSNPEWTDESVVHHLFMETNTTGHNGTTGGTDNAMVPRNSYDVGHLFSGRTGSPTTGGGAAYLQGVCNDVFVNGLGPIKSGGGSGLSNPQGAGWVDLLSHEFTHQFNASHTWSGNTGNCTPDQFAAGGLAAFEPGGGSTIVSYAAICAPQNIPNQGNISYYHTHSIKEVDDWIEGATATCESNVNSNNSVPVPNATPCGASYNMPTRTPFELTGSATDANDPASQLTYCWEQYNNANNQFNPIDGPTLKNPNNGIYPIIRSRFPSGSPTRTFPQLDIIASGNYNGDAQNAATLTLNNWQGELLPEVAGNLTLRLTVRDNNTTSGGVEHADVTINVVNTGAPFALTAPNSGTLTAGNNTTVTWNVAGTTDAPISCANVAIKLSIDGGLTYPFTLAASTANDGTEEVSIPSTIPNTTTARIRVECGTTCFKFFDISNSNVTVTSGCPATTNNICPTAAMSFNAGDAGLNLALSSYIGAPITSNAFDLTANSPTGPLANATVQNGTTCQTAWGDENYEVLDFAVSATGNYAFTDPSNSISFAVFTAAGYNSAMPCSGTFVGSNSYGAISWDQTRTLNLTACTAYKLVVWTVQNNYGTKNITISGPGSVYKIATPPANTAYTYVAVNTTNNQVAAQSATSNFTSLTGGSYRIYGVSYKNGGPTPPPNADPTTWIGQTVEAILASNCAVFSSNFKPVTVTGSANNCTPNLAVTGNVASNTYRSQGELTASDATVTNGATVQFISDTSVLMSTNVTVELGATFDALIQTCATPSAPVISND